MSEVLAETEEEPVEAPVEPQEPAEGDEPEEEEEEPEAEPEPEPDVETPEELEAKRTKLARSATTWRNRVSDVLGEEAQFLVACELCEPDIPGFHFPTDVMQPIDETQARLLEVLRTPEGPEYKAAGDVARCIHCDGWGKVTTGSRNAAQLTKTCGPCLGYGFQPPPGLRDSAPGDGAPAPAFVPSPDGPQSQEQEDAWHSPKLLADGQPNPNWGRMPQYKDPAFP